jgi:glutamate-1-semialdehyde 2,1-aminomutase
MGCAFFTGTPVFDFATAQQADTRSYAIFFQEMLQRGVYLAPSQFEAFFVSLAHGQSDLDFTIDAAVTAFKKVSEQWGASNRHHGKSRLIRKSTGKND